MQMPSETNNKCSPVVSSSIANIAILAKSLETEGAVTRDQSINFATRLQSMNCSHSAGFSAEQVTKRGEGL